MLKRTISLAVVFVMGWAVFAGSAAATTIDENFTTDPGWLAVNNRPAGGLGQDFGYSATNNAGGTAGEMGGLFNLTGSSSSHAYYGVDLGTTLNLSNAFEMNWSSTNPALMYYDSNGGGLWGERMFIGFFGRSSGGLAEATPRPTIGMRKDDQDWQHLAGLSGGASAGMVFTPLGQTTHTLRMKYDPAVGDNGSIQVNLDGAVTTLGLTASQRASSDVFDTFGFVAYPQGAPSEATSLHVYFDNLSFTGVPEPGSLALLATGLVALLAYAWRKRR